MSLDDGTAPSKSTLRGERRLAAALTELGIVPVAVAPLPALKPWSRTPRTYSVTTPAHDRLKIRFARRARFAGRAARLTAQLADPRVASPIAVSGAAMVERWVEGEPLSSLTLSRPHVDAAADILATVHGFGTPRQRATGALAERISCRLARVAAAGMVPQAEARRLERLIAERLPPYASWGLTHGDFCDENLVVGVDESLASIDNELVCFGFLDHDLARTWYRWPMPAWAEERFLRRYDATSGRCRSPEEMQAWRAIATVKGLWIRHVTGSPADLELHALSRLAGGHADRAPAGERASRPAINPP